MIEPKYRTFWPRFWAGAMDGLVLFPFFLVDSWLQHSLVLPRARAAWFVISSYLFIAYSIALHAKYGQTLGKMAFHVEVLDRSEGKLSLKQAVLRDGVPILLTLGTVIVGLPRVAGERPYSGVQHSEIVNWVTLWIPLGWFVAELVTMLINQKRRALHDLIAGSVVVRLGAPLRANAKVSWWSRNLL
jgi:uncharacterized RDD family membrane protein YckC